jgi:hypothetical protein
MLFHDGGQAIAWIFYGHSTVDRQHDTSDVPRSIAAEKHRSVGDVNRCTVPIQRAVLGDDGAHRLGDLAVARSGSRSSGSHGQQRRRDAARSNAIDSDSVLTKVDRRGFGEVNYPSFGGPICQYSSTRIQPPIEVVLITDPPPWSFM